MFNSVLDSDDSTASGNDVASWASIYDQDSKSLTNQFNRLHDSQEDFQTVSAYLILFLCLRYCVREREKERKEDGGTVGASGAFLPLQHKFLSCVLPPWFFVAGC